jgi:hypothetical protein
MGTLRVGTRIELRLPLAWNFPKGRIVDEVIPVRGRRLPIPTWIIKWEGDAPPSVIPKSKERFLHPIPEEETPLPAPAEGDRG